MSILLLVVFFIICSYFVVNKSLKDSPVELMKGRKEKVGFIERKIKLDKLSFNNKFKIKPKDTVKAVNRLDSKSYGITVDSIAETYVCTCFHY